MTAPKPCPPQTELRRRFDYDPATGALTYRISLHIGMKVGEEAGSIKKSGYRNIGIDGKVYQAHRLVWVYVTGKEPGPVLDHINGDRADNRIENLRDVSQSINLLNIHAPSKGNTAGMRGVTFHKQCQKFHACIKKGRRQTYLGLFDTREEAQAAYLAAKARLMA
jgi:hypothetical protein